MCRLVFRSTLTLLTVCICGTCVGHTATYNSLDENLRSLFRFITNGSVISKDELDDFLGTLNLRPHAHDHTHDHDHTHEHDHTHDHDHTHEHDHTHDHDHTHVHVHDHTHEAHNENTSHCYSADELFAFFPNASGLNERQLEQILPTVVHEICTDACHHTHHDHGQEGASIHHQLGWQPILATVGAVLILCASGLIVVVILPLMSRSFYHVVTQFLIALSVGSLTGDAFLHLIPHGISSHDHAHSHSHSHDHGADPHSASHQDMVVKSLVALLGVYLFFITERLTILFQNTKSRRKMKRQWSASADHRRSHDQLDKDGKPNSLDAITSGDGQWPVRLDTPDAANNTGRANFSEGLNGAPDGSSSTPFEGNRLCIRPTERPLNNARCEGHLNDNSHFRAVLSPSKDAGMKKKDSSDGNVHFWPTMIYDSAENDSGTKDPNGSGAAPSLEKALLPPITSSTSLESLSHVMNAHSTHVKVDQVIQDVKAVNEVARTSSHSAGSEAAHPHRDKPHGHHHGHSHDLSSVRAIAYTVIIGDGLHNFCDGIAVGAAFANSLRGGLSTSIAVFCHELPHELGDFAVLLHAGMSAKAALFYNFLSGLLCAVGAAIGLVLGQTEDIDTWLFMLAAGMFVYIALVDMIPELSTNRLKGHRFCHRPSVLFFWQNCGILIGFGVMLLIAFFEEDLKNGL